MPKRKRDHDDSQGSMPTANGRGQNRPIDAKLFHYRKLLQHALRVAKGFERQKLARRYKKAIENDDQANLKRFGIEINAIKSLDLSGAADTHLRRVIGKDKTLAASSALRGHLRNPLELPLHDVSANVVARLCNSNAVKTCVQDILHSLHEYLEKNKPRRKPIKEGLNSDPRGTQSGVHGSQKSSGSQISGLSATDEVGKGLATRRAARGSRSPASEQGSDGGFDDFAHLDDRVADSDASSEMSDAAIEDESIKGHGSTRSVDRDKFVGTNARLRSRSPSIPSASHANLSSIGPDEEEQSSDHLEPITKLRSKGATTFVPSLTMGGYWSGGESDISDVDNDLQPRKNRRGQRARREIWEKKYGKGAKHLKTGQGHDQRQGPRAHQKSRSNGVKRDGRDEGWDPKRGAQGFDGAPGGNKGNGANAMPVGNNRRARRHDLQTESKPEKKHPSWEAKQIAKAAEAAKVGTFQGTRITFD
ncbi:MAG: hypothetical protein M1831_003731 [Alyxoria varia]|nr:MAG: hypothetical protein M1831_003731 [Alyxoria varia]